jgi:DHA2 family multidrug resistance protein-like MFS transporter
MDGLPLPQRRLAMLTIAIAIGASVLGSTLPDVALPSMARDLDVSPAASVWVINAYQIAIIMTLLPFSSLGDIVGYRRVYTSGLVVFTLAALASALAPNLPLLALARMVQGLGAAGLMSVNTALIRYIFPRAQLGRGMGFNSLIVATSAAIGPSAAALILSVASWHWLFAVNVPFCLVALSLVRALPATPRASHRFDLPSALLSAATFGLFIAALDGLGHGLDTLLSVIEMGAAFLVGTVLVRRQLVIPGPMLPVDLFRRPIFALTVATSVCSFIAQTAPYVAIPFLMQSAGGKSAIATGVLMTPWPFTVALVAPMAGRLSDRFSAGLLGAVGLTIMTLGLLSLALLPADPAWWDVAWRMAISGGGFAMFQAPNNRQMISAVPRERSGAGSGMLATARLTGQTSGAALVALCFGMTEALGVAQGARVTILMGTGFAAAAAVLSSLRLSRLATAN